MTADGAAPRPVLGALVLATVLAGLAWSVAGPGRVVPRAELVAPVGSLPERLSARLAELPRDRAPGQPGHAATRT